MVLILPTGPLRTWLMMLMTLSAISYAHASTVLTIDEELHVQQTLMPASGWQKLQPPQSSSSEPVLPLNLSPSLNLQIIVTDPRPDLVPSERLPESVRSALLKILEMIYGSSAVLLGLHILREWVGLLRVRARPPENITLPYAPWPPISILLPLLGRSPVQQCNFLGSLDKTDFGYPRDKIHFVPIFDPTIKEVSEAIDQLTQEFHIHPLPILPDQSVCLAHALQAANVRSVGMALVVCDQFPQISRHWLRETITPLLDPSVGAVLTQYACPHNPDKLPSRLAKLTDNALQLTSTQHNALSLLLAGQAHIRAIRRQALKVLDDKTFLSTPDGSSVVLALTARGWRSHLLNRIPPQTKEGPIHHQISPPRMQPAILLACLQATWATLWPGMPSGCRQQAQEAMFSIMLPMLWLLLCLCSCILFFAGHPLAAAAGVALCAATCFDPYGHPHSATFTAATSRRTGLHAEVRLTPLAGLYFLNSLAQGCSNMLMALVHTDSYSRQLDHQTSMTRLTDGSRS